MEFPRKEIKRNARAALSANYWPVVGIVFLGGVISNILSIISILPTYISMFSQILTYGVVLYSPATSGFSTFLNILGMFVSILIEVGIAYFAYRVYRGDRPEVGDLFVAFKNGQFGRVLGGMVLMSIKIMLWTLLLVIPGIIKGYEYFMVPYLLADRPDLSIKECFKVSKQMTNDHKFDIFVLQLSFFGWAILGGMTLGILDLFYVVPYMTLAEAGAYDFLKRTRCVAPTQQYAGPEQQYAESGQQFTQPEQQYAQPEQTTNESIFEEE